MKFLTTNWSLKKNRVSYIIIILRLVVCDKSSDS